MWDNEYAYEDYLDREGLTERDFDSDEAIEPLEYETEDDDIDILPTPDKCCVDRG